MVEIDSDILGHVNNIMYNRYAETGRVNWITSFAANAEGEKRRLWLEIMSPRGIGFILKSIKTDYKVVSRPRAGTWHFAC